MGYSTILYAIDISELKAAFGSKDPTLLERVRAIVLQKEGGVARVDPTKGPRIHVNWKSEIFLNGKLVTLDEFKQSMGDPKWKDMNLYTYQSGPPRGQKREGPFEEIGSFALFLNTLEAFTPGGINCCTSPQQFAEIDSEEDDITDDQALEELIAGKITQPVHAATYGYALENLCEALGTRLGAVGTDVLKSLKVKTPLSRTRLPVKIPKGDDFPYISYLDAQETSAEVERLQAMDLSYPKDPEVEGERRRFLDLLQNAAAKNRGVVGFYY